MLSSYDVLDPRLPVWGWGKPTTSDGIHRIMDRLFEDFGTAFERTPLRRVPFQSRPSNERGASYPRAQLRDLGDAVSMLVDLPGTEPDQIDLSIEKATVTLRAKAPTSNVPEGFSPRRIERQRRPTEWTFELPYPVDTTAATAQLEQGRLLVLLPKVPEAKPRRIEVKAS